jgi:hypothetical protein
VRLDRYSIDDLHVCAVAEMEDDAIAIGLLNEQYASLRDDYIAVFESLRALRDYPA